MSRFSHSIMSEKNGGKEKDDLVIESVGDAEEFEMKEQPITDQQHELKDRNAGLTKVWLTIRITCPPPYIPLSYGGLK